MGAACELTTLFIKGVLGKGLFVPEPQLVNINLQGVFVF